MACRTVLRSVFLSEQWRPASSGTGLSCSTAAASLFPPARLTLRSRPRNHLGAPLRCSHGEASPSPSSPSPGDQDPPQEAVLKAISEVSKSEGRVAQTTNVVMGGTVTDDSTNEWLALDQKVNSYPTVRGFTAIGTGGDDFVHSMVVAVESVVQQPIPERMQRSEITKKLSGLNTGLQVQVRGALKKASGHVTQKLSSRGKYVSVNIGPIRVVSSEQVQAIYNAMRRDDRMKYFL